MRPRKKDRHLPACMYHKHGAYYLVQRGKWTRLASDLPTALKRYSEQYGAPQGSIGDLIDRYIEITKGDGAARSTLEQYEGVAPRIKQAFIEFSPHQVRPKHIWEFMDYHRSTPNMANRMRTLLNGAFTLAVSKELCERNPVLDVPRFKEKTRDRYLSDDEYRRIWSAGSEALRSIMDIAYATGQRITDVLTIRNDDVLEDGILFRQQKTGARVLVRMTPQLQAAVDRARAQHRQRREYLLAQRNGKVRQYYGVRDLFRRAAERAGVLDVTLHDLRAKSATDARAQGKDAQQLLGHTTEAQTVRYIRNRETIVASGPSIGHPRQNA